MHTLEPLGFAYGGDIPMDLTSIQDQLDEHAKKRVAEIDEPHVEAPDQHVVVGMPDTDLNLGWKPVPIFSKLVDIVLNGIASKEYEIKAY